MLRGGSNFPAPPLLEEAAIHARTCQSKLLPLILALLSKTPSPQAEAARAELEALDPDHEHREAWALANGELKNLLAPPPPTEPSA